MSEAKRERTAGPGGVAEVVDSHESYGILRLSRFEANRTRFFGSPVDGLGGISISISTAERSFDRITGERFYSKRRLLTARMSAVQFAEAITTMNQGDGVPITLEMVAESPTLRECPDPPRQESEAAAIRDEMVAEVRAKEADMKAVADRIDAVLADARVSQVRRNDVQTEIRALVRLFGDSIPFAMEWFEESTGQAVAKAKGEISAFADLVANRTGVEALRSGDAPVAPPRDLALPRDSSPAAGKPRS